MITEAARQQSGATIKHNPDELRRQKEERITEAKKRRKSKKLLQDLENQQQIAAIKSKTISSEEFFESKDEMAEQYRQIIL
jgi:hypothetical protein